MSRLRERSAVAVVSIMSVFLVLSGVLMPVWAESSDEADIWLDKMLAAYKAGPVQASFDMTMITPETGADGMSAAGSIMFDGGKRSRMDMNMTVSMPQMGSEMSMEMVQVFDGSLMWIEMDNPMMGGKIVIKATKAQLEQMSQMGEGMGMGGASMSSPFGPEQMEQMKTLFDWKLLEVADGRATLQATPNPEGMKALTGKDEAMDIPEDTSMVLVLDEATGFPVEMRMSEMISMKMYDVKVLDALPPGAFDYTPPEGATVMDLGQMMGGN